MYSTLPENQRSRHPYHMYDEVYLQPDAVAAALVSAEKQGHQMTRLLARARRVWVTACGTSFHAAQAGSWFLRLFSQGKIDAQAIQAFDFNAYLPGLRPDDLLIAISHSGSTTMTIRALERARRSGVESVLITGFPECAAAKVAQHVLPTGYEAELSWAHTVSYMAAMTSLAWLANSVAEPSEHLDLSPLPEVVKQSLELEEMARRIAASAIVGEQSGNPLRVVVVGAGPNAGTAYEAVLKLLETSYVSATAYPLEEALHGPLAAVTPDTMIIVIAPSGHATHRAVELVQAAVRIGTAPIVLADEGNAASFPDTHVLVLPQVPEVLSPFPAIVPLQLLSYFLSIGKGFNPDLLRRDDERYREAAAVYE